MASEMVEHFPPGHSPNRLATLVDGTFAKYFNIKRPWFGDLPFGLGMFGWVSLGCELNFQLMEIGVF
jgi:hypothetical protein